MTTAHASTALYTAASVGFAVSILLAFHLAMAHSAANRFVAGFVACLIASPVMLVAHVGAAIAMAAVGLVCAVPACVLAEDHDDDGRGGGGGAGPVDSDSGPGSDSDLWVAFERDFWLHVERAGRLVSVR